MEDPLQGNAREDDDGLVVFPGTADPRAIEVNKPLKLSRKNPFDELDELVLMGGHNEALMLGGSG
jgi:hypothetical protein